MSGGRPSIADKLIKEINDFAEAKSSVASNRMVLKRTESNVPNREKEYLHARYLEDTKTKIFQDFPLKDDLSKSSFFKYLNASKIYKKPHR